MTAYNYKTQKWITGEEARLERNSQLNDEGALLQSDKGDEYAAFLGIDKHQRIEQIKLELDKLR